MSDRVESYSKNADKDEVTDDTDKEQVSKEEVDLSEELKEDSSQEDKDMSSSSSSSSVEINRRYVSCIGESVPCDNGNSDNSSECPLLAITELSDVQQWICDKDYEVSTKSEFKIKQADGLFKPNSHYWFQVRPDETIRFIAPYAEDVVDFFQDHYYIDNIGQSSLLLLEEFISSYNEDDPGKYVIYAGTWQTDENGKIIYWSNDSGHYEPSVDYAAPIAQALGITDAMFIPWTKEDQDYSIMYTQYKVYTGAYHAKSEMTNLINGGKEKESIFYPHNYHQWYKYHGNKGENNYHFEVHGNGHGHGHGQHHADIAMLWIGLFIAVLCCMIGIIVSFVVPRKNKGHVYEKNVSMVLSDVSEENNEEYDEEVMNT